MAGGLVHGIELVSGTINWTVAIGEPVSVVTVADEESILVATETGRLYKIR